jgi:hypothetical protein
MIFAMKAAFRHSRLKWIYNKYTAERDWRLLGLYQFFFAISFILNRSDVSSFLLLEPARLSEIYLHLSIGLPVEHIEPAGSHRLEMDDPSGQLHSLIQCRSIHNFNVLLGGALHLVSSTSDCNYGYISDDLFVGMTVKSAQ